MDPMSRRSTAKRGGDFSKVEELLALMQRNGLAEIEWEKGDERIHLKSAMVASTIGITPTSLVSQRWENAPAALPEPAGAPIIEQRRAEPAAKKSNIKDILSPFVGTFYRSASPEAEPYVTEGKKVKPGEVLCIIEAMKLMNEIEAEISCKVLTILVENGQPVEFGEPLFQVELDPA